MSREASPVQLDAHLLLGGAWRPVTNTIMFARASASRVANELINGVRGAAVLSRFGYPLRSTRVPAGELRTRLSRLLPLDPIESRRILIVATANQEWCSWFESHWRGLDTFSPMLWMAGAQIETVAVTEIPHRPRLPGWRASYGARKITTYENGSSARGRALAVQALSANKWGMIIDPDNPFTVGSVYDLTARRVQDRFSHEHLLEMTRRYGLRPFDEDFYPPDGDAYLIERTDPLTPRDVPISLAQAQGLEPLDLSAAQ